MQRLATDSCEQLPQYAEAMNAGGTAGVRFRLPQSGGEWDFFDRINPSTSSGTSSGFTGWGMLGQGDIDPKGNGGFSAELLSSG